MKDPVWCWAGGTTTEPLWEVVAASKTDAGRVEITHFHGPNARARAEAYAKTLRDYDPGPMITLPPPKDHA